MEQLYAIQIDRCVSWNKPLEFFEDGKLERFVLHSGGRGNGAVGGLYTKKQLNRIIGKYPEGAAKAIPVAFGYTQSEAEEWNV